MSNNISSIGVLVQNFAQSASQSQVQELAQIAMLKKAQDIQAQSILPLLDAVVENSPKLASPTDSIGKVLDVRA
ncbi:putative motility protein [Halothiobacillus sp.]|uniref:putative motility protein n=1 Tax=Halothiobacillus sp. TaxID=1891311 RepID=UPI00261C3A12|nr:putative motility protein [Halothiobacillus sp.]